MVIVMQLFAANPKLPRENISRCITTLEITVTPIMADPIYKTCSKERNPHHLKRPDGNPWQTKQNHINDKHQGDTHCAVLGVNMTLHPVIRGAMPVTRQGFL